MGQRSSILIVCFFLLFHLILGLGFSSAGAFADPEDWPSITDAERTVKDCPGQPGAAAVYLRREQTSNDNDWTFKTFFRLKVLTPAGRDYGIIEVPFSEAWRVKDIKARVIQPDGQVVPFAGEIFEKTIIQVGRLRRLVKTFALPGLEVGSIIDCRYELKFDLNKSVSAGSLRLEKWKPEEGGIPTDRTFYSYIAEIWDFDAPLYTFIAKYTYIPFRGGQFFSGGSSFHLAWVSYGLLSGPPVMNNGRVELEVRSIPPHEREELAAPEEEGRMGVIFFICDTKVQSAADYWRLESGRWQNAVEKFLGARGVIFEESRALTAEVSTPLDKLKSLYARAQAIKNLSYEKDMTPTRRKELEIKDNRNVGEVLKRNAGLRSDITRTFVALARASGFTAEVARVVTRDDKLFHENILGLYGQFDSEVAIVEVDGREMYFDPATPGCPLGLLPWESTDTTIIQTGGMPGKFSSTPLDLPERSVIRRVLNLRLAADGGLSGTALLTCTGQEALRLRLRYLGMADAEMRRGLSEEMGASLSAAGRAAVREVENMTGSEDELRIEFDIDVPGVLTPAGDRLILPVMPYRTVWRDSFRHAMRTSSVCFPYLAREIDDIVIAIPEGMKIETIPETARSGRSFASYTLSAEVEAGTKLRVRRELTIMKNRIPADKYPVLKSFFDQARAGDEGQAILAVEKK